MAALAALLAVATSLARPALAALATLADTGVTLTITVSSGFARSAPSRSATRTASVFKGQVFPVNGQIADGSWLLIGVVGAPGDTWVPAQFGAINGDLSQVPVSEVAAATPATPAEAPSPGPLLTAPVIPSVSQTAREIYQRGLAMGNNPRHFSKIGDCQNVPPFFLAPYDYGPGAYSLGDYAYLQAAIDQFDGSFARESVTVAPGFNVASMFVPFWADPQRCQPGETPLECEYRLYRPAIAVVSMEQWWGGAAAGYESYLRAVVKFLVAHGVVPILATKADNVEGDYSINLAVQRVAAEYELPLWNFWLAVQPLPNHGLHPDGFHLTWAQPFFDDAERLQKSWPRRNLTALQAVDAVWRGVAAP